MGRSTSSFPATDPWIGRTLGGSVVRTLIGEGGMGRVYCAEQTTLGRLVAIKLLHPRLAQEPRVLERFEREARAASRLNHPHTVAIFDYGLTAEERLPYLAMEHLTGRTLAQAVHAEDPLPIDRVVAITLQILDAIADAHEHGVIHRDLKPENVFLVRRRDGRESVKVVDFGLADLVDARENKRITEPDLVLATPGFAAPEQLAGKRVDARADLYSLGAVLFEMLTGRLPIVARTFAELIALQIIHPAPDPREVAPKRSIPAALAIACTRALAREPEKRFASADTMADAIRDAARSLRRRPCSSAPAAAITQPLPIPTLPAEVPAAALDLLDALRQRSERGVRLVALLGGTASGKSATLHALGDRALADGDLVIRTGPHRSRAQVPYAAIRTALADLARRSPAPTLTPLARTGLAEIERPAGLVGVEGASRAGAVAAALAASIEAAASRQRSGRVVLMVDDAHVCDELSREVLAAFRVRFDRARTLVVFATADPSVVDGFDELPVLRLDPPDPETPGPAPAVEAVEQALAPLGVEPRRLLHAVCVLGVAAPEAQVVAVHGAPIDPAALASLIGSGLARLEGSTFVVSPLVRDVVHLGIPAEARRELHRRALTACEHALEPIEVLAEHASFEDGGAPENGQLPELSGLMLLERAGEQALLAGAPRAAALSFRRALEIARREHARTSDELAASAITIFGRKLAIALRHLGRPIEADGMLREVIDAAEPGSLALADALVELGRAVAARGRRREGLRHVDRAVTLASAPAGSRLGRAEVWLRIAEARREALDLHGAEQALQEASDLAGVPASAETSQPGVIGLVSQPVLLARIGLALGRVQAALGAERAARRILVRASAFAAAGEAMALSALALGAVAEIDEANGDVALACQSYGDALRRAAAAGDAESAARFERSRARLSCAGEERISP